MRARAAAGANHKPCLLAMDAGGTYTRALVVTPEGISLGGAKTGPSNSFLVSESLAGRNIRRAVRDALISANVPSSSIAAVVLGSAGVEWDGLGSKPIIEVLRRDFPSAPLRVVADAQIALEGALGGAPGVVIVSGTGSVVLGRGPGGRYEKAGGWGPLMGDEGSAPWIAQQALQATAQAADGTAPATALTRVVMKYFHTRSFRRIVEPVYQQDMTSRQLGGLAPLVAHVAKEGDRAARAIFQHAGFELARQAAAVVNRMKLPRAKISYQGSVFLAGSTLLTPLRRSLGLFAPQAELVRPILPPIGGAFLLALRLAGYKIHAKEIANFHRTCQV